MSITDSEPPGCPEPAWVSMWMMRTRLSRAMSRSRPTSGFAICYPSSVARIIRAVPGRRKRSASLEQLDPHALARLDVAPLFLDHDEAVGLCHGGEDPGALRAGGTDLPPLGGVGEDPALELAPARPLAHALDGHRVELRREELAAPRQLPERGTDEEIEGEHGGHRVAGQPEEVGAPDAAERQ